MEPIIMNLGVLIPEKGFMSQLRDLCTKYGTLLILDEVASGFGTTGRMFASEHFGVVPDIMTMAKSLTGGYGGMGATITTVEIADAVEGQLQLYSTFGWHPTAVEAALANLDYISEHEQQLFEHINAMGAYFRERIGAMKFKNYVELRSIGLAIGIDCNNDTAYANEILEKCTDAGLLVNTQGATVCMFPALNIDKKIAEAGLDVFETCV